MYAATRRAAYIECMTNFCESTVVRDAAGKFDEKVHTAPEAGLGVPRVASPEDMVYSVLVDGNTVVRQRRGESLNQALESAALYPQHHPEAVISIVGAGYDETENKLIGGVTDVEFRPASEGRLVAWIHGDAYGIEELDAAGITLLGATEEGLEFEPFIDTARDIDIDSLDDIQQALFEADMPTSYVSARSDEDNPDIVNVDVAVYENFLWDLPDEEEERDERRELLDTYRHIVDEVFAESFNATIADVPDDWDSVMVELRVPVPRDRFTTSLVINDTYNALAKYRNETDPGTFGSPYVMAEVWARIEKAKAEAEGHRP